MQNPDLESNGRTVLHLARFFAELQERARQVVANSNASQRGYFSPREEEATGELLVSYWHARNALFDLITSLRRVPQSTAGEQDQAFLIGFAAALLLVDAARFLRETVESRPLVKRKLNEPIPAFGVPGDVYNMVQKSLLSSYHGWHLYHAVKYFSRHEDDFKAGTTNEQRQALLAVIDRLRHRLDVPLRQFAQAKLKTRGKRWGGHVKRRLFGRAMYGLQKLMGTLMAEKYLRLGHQPSLPPAIADELQAILEPGDVLACRKEYALTNYFLPGYWPHVALYLGPAGTMEELATTMPTAARPRFPAFVNDDPHAGLVIESMRDGVQVRPLDSPFGSDSIAVIRPRLANPDVVLGLTRSLNHFGKPYDFGFDFRRSDRLVCTEVVYRAFDGVGPMHMPLVQRLGRPTLSGNDLICMALSRQSFEAVAVYAPAFSERIIKGPETSAMISQAQASRTTVEPSSDERPAEERP